jgi:hypothetical protein
MKSIGAEVDAASSRVLGKTKAAGSRFYFAIGQLTLTAVSRSFRAFFSL